MMKVSYVHRQADEGFHRRPCGEAAFSRWNAGDDFVVSVMKMLDE